MKKLTRTKLVLNRNTLRALAPIDDAQLCEVAGGRINLTRPTQCECPTFTCNGCTLF